jgi:hypothetical protein
MHDRAPKVSALAGLVLLMLALAPLMVPAGASSPSGWSAPARLFPEPEPDAPVPHLSADAGGNVTAVWDHPSFDGNSVNSSRLAAGGVWGPETTIDNTFLYEADNPAVAAGQDGTATAVWTQSDGAVLSAWGARYYPANGWRAPVLLETDDSGDVAELDVATDGAGHAVAVWAQYDGVWHNAVSNYYTEGTGWGTATLLETTDGDVNFPRVAMDSGGFAYAVWNQFNGSVSDTWAARFTPGTGWASAVKVDTDDTGDARNPHVLPLPAGGAVALWDQYISGQLHTFTISAQRTGAWSVPLQLDSNSPGATGVSHLAVGSRGDAVAVWLDEPSASVELWSAYRSAGGSWGAPERANDGNSSGVFLDDVCVDDGGVATAVWLSADGYHLNLWGSRRGPSGWGTAVLVETDNSGNALYPTIAPLPEGGAIAAWVMSGYGQYTLWTSTFTPPDTTAPSLTVTSPGVASTTNVSSVRVVGTTERGASVSANGVLAAVAADGSFSVLVALAPGANTVEVRAWDASGNVATSTVSVTYNDASAGLEAELAAARARLQGAEDALAATNVTLEQTRTQMAASDADLQARTAAAAGAAGAAAMLGLLGIVVGLAGTGIALATMRKGKAPKTADESGTAKAGEAKPSESQTGDKPK